MHHYLIPELYNGEGGGANVLVREVQAAAKSDGGSSSSDNHSSSRRRRRKEINHNDNGCFLDGRPFSIDCGAVSILKFSWQWRKCSL